MLSHHMSGMPVEQTVQTRQGYLELLGVVKPAVQVDIVHFINMEMSFPVIATMMLRQFLAQVLRKSNE